jgi:hypothetical protein
MRQRSISLMFALLPMAPIGCSLDRPAPSPGQRRPRHALRAKSVSTGASPDVGGILRLLTTASCGRRRRGNPAARARTAVAESRVDAGRCGTGLGTTVAACTSPSRSG